jgi:hypothetical protein
LGIDCSSSKLFFDESQSDEILKKVEGSYAVHIWNKMSSEEKIIVDRNRRTDCWQRNCPRFIRTVDVCTDFFCQAVLSQILHCFVKTVTQLLNFFQTQIMVAEFFK